MVYPMTETMCVEYTTNKLRSSRSEIHHYCPGGNNDFVIIICHPANILFQTFSIPCSSVYLIDRKKDRDWTNSIWSKCNKKCQHGYATDVEGNSICKCNDPCAVSSLYTA